jgi:hypothetical protein
MDWTSFYMVTAGASATLVGLLFIGVQFNIELFVVDLSNRWNAVARSTFEIFSILFLVSLLFLIPSLDDHVRAIGLLVGVGGGVVRAVVTWRPVMSSIRDLARSDLLGQTFWLLIWPLLAYFVFAESAGEYLTGNSPTLNQANVAFAMLALFSICLRNSWRLLFDVAMERKNKGKNPD